ncbi:MAG: Ig-like domain-containing protein [Chromatiales bacterium]|nr:Ig-like domain-containing protein [Chromatiales bacterium]
MNRKALSIGFWKGITRLFAVLSCLLLSGTAFAVDSICALVKIEIEQTLTLERQAFDARMVITNHLDTVALENVKVDVVFTDEEGNSVLASSDPNNTAAQFFIRVDSLEGIADVSGSGTVSPGAEAEAHWLIIPAPGAGGSVASGKRYDVGAVLRYTQNGEQKEIAVAPDLIFVKPLPQLNLDYFLTEDVVADNPFTAPVEPPQPFVLGVRVANNGGGAAKDLSIDTAQPKIVENEQELLIDFRITGAQVNEEPAEPVLLMNFGDIEAGQSKVGRWQMETNLSGSFVEFEATFSHGDDLGGRLTSLIDTIDTHLLLHDVRVDLPGRDRIQDFLAKDGDVIRVFESDNVDTVVENLSSEASPSSQSGINRQLTVPATLGMAYIELPDPHEGAYYLTGAYRRDGTQLPLENAWLSVKTHTGGALEHKLHIFDYAPSTQYTLVFGAAQPGNEAPVLQFISDQTIAVGSTLSFLVEASDPNGTIPAVSTSPLPPGATLVADSQTPELSRYIFEWTPQAGKNGAYRITFSVSDGALSSAREVLIRVTSPEDTDGDGMLDSWEIATFGSLAQDETTDYDNDGILDIVDPYPLNSASGQCEEVDGVVTVTNSEYQTGESVECSATSSIQTSETVTVKSGATVTYTAPLITLNPGFTAEAGADFVATSASAEGAGSDDHAQTAEDSSGKAQARATASTDKRTPAANYHTVDTLPTALRALLSAHAAEATDISANADNTVFVFVTVAQLTTNDTNSLPDVYLYDIHQASLRILSRGLDGYAASGVQPKIDGLAQYVVYTSQADNIVVDDTNGLSDIFFYDFRTDEVTRISSDAQGNQATTPSVSADISTEPSVVVYSKENAEGHLKIFEALPGGNKSEEIVLSNGDYQTFDHQLPTISSNGRYVAFMATSMTDERCYFQLLDRQTGESHSAACPVEFVLSASTRGRFEANNRVVRFSDDQFRTGVSFNNSLVHAE